MKFMFTEHGMGYVCDVLEFVVIPASGSHEDYNFTSAYVAAVVVTTGGSVMVIDAEDLTAILPYEGPVQS